jgi:uncharacterized protein (TIGR03435 family)
MCSSLDPLFPVRISMLLAAVCIAVSAPVWAQNGTVSALQGAPKQFAYEVVSIAPSKTASEDSGIRSTPDGIIVSNAPLGWLVRYAYNIISDEQISGLPGWADSERYDIQAKMDDETVDAWKNLTREERKYQEQRMIRALLAKRCELKIHRETKQLPVYNLVIAKGGLKMKEASGESGGRFMANRGQFDGTSSTIATLLYSLSSEFGRLVIDKTELGGRKFDFKLRWTPEEQSGTPDAGPSLISALEEQLGLRLESSRGPVETVVVDHVDKPSPN